MNQVEALEQAILERAEQMAAEIIRKGETQAHAELRSAHEQLRVLEEKETQLAKANAERMFRRQVQKDELKLQAEYDHTRWGLINRTLKQLSKPMAALRADQPRYDDYLKSLLVQAAAQLNQPTLVVRFNAEDRERLSADWTEFTAQLDAATRFECSANTLNTLSGFIAESPDGKLRLDQTFEGRLDRLRAQIQQRLAERMLSTRPGGVMG